MKLKQLFSVTRNKNNKQYIFSLRIKQLRKMNINTPEELEEFLILKPKTKFYKK